MKGNYYSKIYFEEKEGYLLKNIFLKGYNINDELQNKIEFLDWVGLCFFENKISIFQKNIIKEIMFIISSRGFNTKSILSGINTAIQKGNKENIIITGAALESGKLGLKEIKFIFDIIQNKDDLLNMDRLVLELKDKKIENIDFEVGFNNGEESLIFEKISKNIKIKYGEKIEYTNLYLKNQGNIEERIGKKSNLNLLAALLLKDIDIPEKSIEHFLFFLFLPFFSSLTLEQNDYKRIPFINKD